MKRYEEKHESFEPLDRVSSHLSFRSKAAYVSDRPDAAVYTVGPLAAKTINLEREVFVQNNEARALL